MLKFTPESKSVRGLVIALFICTPFLGVLLLGLLTGTDPFRIDMRLSYPGDEMIYAQGIKTILRYFIPQGWMTFNEVQAMVPTFGAWSPLVFYLYALVALLLGGWHGYDTVMIVNVFLIVSACAGFVILARPNTKKLVSVTAFFLVNLLLSHYIWSGNTEPLFFSFSIWIGGLSTALWRGDMGTRKAAVLFGCLCFIILLYGICRPYAFALILIPLLYAYRGKKWFAAVSALLTVLIGLVTYYLLSTRASAPYLDNGIINLSAYRSAFVSGDYIGILCIMKLKIGVLIDSFVLGSAYMRGILLIMFVEFTLTFFQLRKQNKSLLFIILSSILAIFTALVLLYDYPQIGRHLLSSIILLGMLLICESDKCSTVWPLSIAALLCSCLLMRYQCTLDTLMLPNATEQQTEVLSQAEAALSDNLTLTPGDLWANTIDWDGSVPYPEYNGLFSTPAGFAVGVVWPDHLLPYIQEGTLKARYVFTKEGSEVFTAAAAAGFPILCAYSDYVILQNENYARIDTP